VTLFIAVQTMFDTFATANHAGEGASSSFSVFNYYHLSLAAAAMCGDFYGARRSSGRR